MDVSKTQVSNLGDEVVMVDPTWPWTVRAKVAPDASGRAMITAMTIEARNGQPITATTLGEIPVRQICHVAASVLAGEGEAQYRMLATPRPDGVRSWPPEHFQKVARVAAWARATGRPGGAAGAVAEFWGVHYRTARRWISHPPA